MNPDTAARVAAHNAQALDMVMSAAFAPETTIERPAPSALDLQPLAELEACKARIADLETDALMDAYDREQLRGVIDVLTEGNGVADDDLWTEMKSERDALRVKLADALRDRNAYAKKLCLMVLMRYSPLDTLALQGGIIKDRKVAMEEFELVFLRALTEATAAAKVVQT